MAIVYIYAGAARVLTPRGPSRVETARLARRRRRRRRPSRFLPHALSQRARSLRLSLSLTPGFFLCARRHRRCAVLCPHDISIETHEERVRDTKRGERERDK